MYATKAKVSTTRPRSLTTSPSLSHFVYVLTIYRYVLLCLLFGSMSAITGLSLLFLAIILRTKTSSLHLLESVPLYMPGLILICNGISLIAFMNKNTRRFYLLKSVCGLFILVALLLIIVSVTTSVIHLPRLHSHRQCVYTPRVRACTCVHNPSLASTIASKHFIMEDVINCEIVHGAIYDSLRVIFALSLISLVVSLFSILTLYQLYIHEKHKLYFNQLNVLRKKVPPKLVNNVAPVLSHNYPTASVVTESTHFEPIKCLSADFSSQDLLLDQSSANLALSHYEESIVLSKNTRVWSSHSTTFAKSHNDLRSSDHSRPGSESGHNHSGTNLRRYMSAIIDTSSNVQSFVRRKLHSLRGSDPVNSRRHTSHYNRVSKQHSLPPHVFIPRYSMTQLSFDSNVHSALEYNQSGAQQGARTNSLYSSTSSYPSSSSFHSSRPKQKESHHERITSLESDVIQSLPDLELTLFKDENELTSSKYELELVASSMLQDVEEACTDFTIAYSEPQIYTQTEASISGKTSNENVLELARSSEKEQPVGLSKSHWSHSGLMDTFKCLDEEDYYLGAQTQLEVILSQHIARVNQVILQNQQCFDEEKEEEKKTKSKLDMNPIDQSAQEPTSHTASIYLNRNLTPFEEAFKNYYDSQNRISNYYTMPLKIPSKDRSKIKPDQTLNKCPQPDENLHVHSLLAEAERIEIPLLDQKTPKIINMTISDEEMPFPAIEPPIDYQNATTYENDHEFKQKILNPLANSLMQPYHIWLQQFTLEMERIEREARLSYESSSNEDHNEQMENGLIEDDDDDDDNAGDTSTSQDIADFELELDEEPIQFMSEEECLQSTVSKREAEAPKTTNLRTVIQRAENECQAKPQLEWTQGKHHVGKGGVRHQEEYAFHGFRCFDESSSSSSGQSSLTNRSAEASTNSLPMAYIKPPTPFTNYRRD